MIEVLVALIVAGVLLWLVTSFIPMHPTIRNLLVGVVVIFLVLWVLEVFGVLHMGLAPWRVHR